MMESGFKASAWSNKNVTRPEPNYKVSVEDRLLESAQTMEKKHKWEREKSANR